jgi:uncharacterized phage-associated protein
MDSPDVDREKVANAIIALLGRARELSLSITRMKLAKLLYLADLHSVERTGRAGSGVPWQWLDYGPYSRCLRSIEDALSGSVLTHEVTNNYFGSPELRLSIAEPQKAAMESTNTFMEDIEWVLKEWGAQSPTTLKDYTYQTLPMIEIQESGERGDFLDLDATPDLPPVSRIVARLKMVLHSIPNDVTDEEDDSTENADDDGFFRRLRMKSTNRIL